MSETNFYKVQFENEDQYDSVFNNTMDANEEDKYIVFLSKNGRLANLMGVRSEVIESFGDENREKLVAVVELKQGVKIQLLENFQNPFGIDDSDSELVVRPQER